MSTSAAVRAPSADAGTEPVNAGPLAMPVKVVRVSPISPNMVRITVAGNGIRRFNIEGDDQWMRVLLPRQGQREPRLPTTEHWWPEICAMPESVQPIVGSDPPTPKIARRAPARSDVPVRAATRSRRRDRACLAAASRAGSSPFQAYRNPNDASGCPPSAPMTVWRCPRDRSWTTRALGASERGRCLRGGPLLPEGSQSGDHDLNVTGAPAPR